MHFVKGNSVRFLSVVRELESAGKLDKGQIYPFEFPTNKPYDSYNGIKITLRYFVRVVVTKAYNKNITKELGFAVEYDNNETITGTSINNNHTAGTTTASSTGAIMKDVATDIKTAVIENNLSLVPLPKPIKMEVGIDEFLHIEFEYNKAKYDINDVITGKINFLLVRIKIKYMELAMIRRETSGTK